MAKTTRNPATPPAPKSNSPAALLGGLTAEEMRAGISGEPAKVERIEMRVTADEKQMIQNLADQCGVSVTKMLVTLAELATARLRS